MTSKDYRAFAAAIRLQVEVQRDLLTDQTPVGPHGLQAGEFASIRLAAIESMGESITRVLAADNGRFDRGRFYRAAGLEIRPDGSLWPVPGRDAVR
jgi:hypothetical protein